MKKLFSPDTKMLEKQTLGLIKIYLNPIIYFIQNVEANLKCILGTKWSFFRKCIFQMQ